jgi:Zn-dependent peptidase ImmA (M78 family)
MIHEGEKSVLQRHLSETPVKLGALARDLGIEVFKSSMKPGISGLIEPSSTARSGYRIKINRHESVERQRFTLAHEISHYLLHREHIRNGVIDSTMYRSNLSNKQEIEANRLASRIVMPDAAIAQLRRKYSGFTFEEMVHHMARELRVSEPAMRIKLGG